MVDLFGGAITTSIPPSWRDVSQVRQVPDNQEVYQDCSEETGAVLVVEILEFQSNVDNSNACDFFLTDLGDANGAVEQIIHTSRVVNLLGFACEENKEQLFPSLALMPTTTLQSQLHACVARGSQKIVQKGNTAAHWVDIELCALRLKDVETDLLITLSIPRKEEKNRSSGDSRNVAGVDDEIFKQILTSFNIKDWSLFG